MPYLGYVLLLPVIGYVERYDHWVVLVILSWLGISMILDSFKKKEEAQSSDRFTMKVLLAESVATSIDALSSCIILPTFMIAPELSCFTIFSVTFIICLIGHRLGRKLALILKDKASIAGGVILILLGIKCVLEHLGYL